MLVEPSESIFISCYVSTYIFVFISKAWCMPYKRPDSRAHKKLYLPPPPPPSHNNSIFRIWLVNNIVVIFEWVDGIPFRSSLLHLAFKCKVIFHHHQNTSSDIRPVLCSSKILCVSFSSTFSISNVLLFVLHSSALMTFYVASQFSPVLLKHHQPFNPIVANTKSYMNRKFLFS